MQSELNLLDVPDPEIIFRLEKLHRVEKRTQARFLAYLNTVEERQLYAGEGYSSLFTYLVEHFHYSASSALRRIQVARLARRFPEIYALISEATLSLSHLQVLAPHLTSQNVERLLALAQAQSVRELAASLAVEFGRPAVPDRVGPLSQDSYQVQFTADQEFLDKLNHAKALLGRKYPSGRLALVLGEALDLLLESEGNRQCRPVLLPAQKTCGITQEDIDTQEAIRESFGDPELKNTPRYIRRRIRLAVWQRDEGKCQFLRKDGSRCGETKYLEFDHVLPWARGGSSQVASNVRLLCRAHNQWNARQDFGPRFNQ